jgi:hypothetical protein
MRAIVRRVGPASALLGVALVWVGALSLWARTSIEPDAMAAASTRSPVAAAMVEEWITASYTWVEGSDHAWIGLLLATAVIPLAIATISAASRAVAASVAAIGAAVGALAIATRVDADALLAPIIATAPPAWPLPPLRDSIVVEPGWSTRIVLAGAAAIVVGGALSWASALERQQAEAR